jgi:sugar phosphate isomerase/epimerase
MKHPQPRISFSTLACPDWPWEEIASRAAEYGYNGVEVRLIERETDLLKRREFAEESIAANLDLLESRGLAVCGLASSVRFDDLERDVRDAELAIGKLYITLANRLGAEFIRVFGDVLPPENEPAARHQVIRNIAAGLDALAEFSDLHNYGVDVLIETHGDFADSKLLLELLVHVRHPRVGVLWDTHHPWRFFGEPVAETYARLRPWIRHTHWKDSRVAEVTERTAAELAAAAQARRTNRGHREASYVMFGTGEFPAGETMSLLTSGGYTGWCSLEWEKAWHPNLADPDIALPPFPAALRRLVPSA